MRAQARFAVLLIAAAVGCMPCSKDEHVAELTAIDKAVDRDFAASVGKWQKADKGATFHIGDGLRTGPGASAQLRLLPGGRMRVESDAIVRFQRTPPGQTAQSIQLEGGQAEIESGGLQIDVHTANGIASLGKASKLKVQAGEDGLRLSLLGGTADIVEEGERKALVAGEELVLGVGAAQIEVEPEPEPEPEAEQPVVDAGGAEELSEEEKRAEEKALGRLDTPPERSVVAISAGESATIHDPRPPSNVRISLSKCPEGGLVELGKSRRYSDFRVKGQTEAIVRADKGRYRYRVRCLEKGKPARRPAARGRLTIARDPGSRRLPLKAPAVTVDADGRRYTVRYANTLPRLGFRWPRAPQASSYTLKLQLSTGGAVNSSSSKSTVQLKSGMVPEGVHRFHFVGGGAKSKTGTLEVAFDNTARTAYLSAPADGVATAGQPVSVSGAALPKSQVSIDAVPVPLKAQGRFEAQVTAPTDRDAIAVRVRHPSTGIHYYLRRLAGAAK